jgi:hypothetical protein
MNRIYNHIQSFLFTLIYFSIILILYHLLSIFIPKVIYGTWRSYLIWGFLFDIIGAIIPLLFVFLGKILSGFYRSKLSVITCIAITYICFSLTEIHLWQYISALYYASFWEYFWGVVFSLFTFVFYTMTLLSSVYYNKFK